MCLVSAGGILCAGEMEGSGKRVRDGIYVVRDRGRARSWRMVGENREYVGS